MKMLGLALSLLTVSTVAVAAFVAGIQYRGPGSADAMAPPCAAECGLDVLFPLDVPDPSNDHSFVADVPDQSHDRGFGSPEAWCAACGDSGDTVIVAEEP